MTEDFHFFYRLVRRLKERGEPFVSLTFHDPVPWNVTVVITTLAEKERVPFSLVAAHEDPDMAINMAKAMRKGGSFGQLIVGIDPGRTIGVAIFGDGRLLLTEELGCPEETARTISRLTEGIVYDELLIRIGHGDRTVRNRIIKNIWPLADRVEIVDETNTTRNTERPDIDAAILISKLEGEQIDKAPEIRPTPGEVREVQRQSRLCSEGRVTISKELASSVARGRLRMDEALEIQSHVDD
ncbi:MAG: hypothetical protein A4E32_00009 [Methanomassiliicoccales archaeon PtaU1.Bin124]|nr:MAG: hypothetical protein A4E32_00009 [Methanomassiliicoccales archaeon PtaU1.Bin124]